MIVIIIDGSESQLQAVFKISELACLLKSVVTLCFQLGDAFGHSPGPVYPYQTICILKLILKYLK